MSVSPALIQAERVDWPSLRCGCGQTGTHIPEEFATSLTATSSREFVEASLEGHVYVRSLLFEVAVPVTAMIVAALHEHTSDEVRLRLLDELGYCVGGESHWTEIEAGAPEIEIDFQIAAREGIWALYREYESGHAMMARMILDAVDTDRERFAYFDEKLIGRLHKRK